MKSRELKTTRALWIKLMTLHEFYGVKLGVCQLLKKFQN